MTDYIYIYILVYCNILFYYLILFLLILLFFHRFFINKNGKLKKKKKKSEQKKKFREPLVFPSEKGMKNIFKFYYSISFSILPKEENKYLNVLIYLYYLSVRDNPTSVVGVISCKIVV